jgi:hypothetical protein
MAESALERWDAGINPGIDRSDRRPSWRASSRPGSRNRPKSSGGITTRCSGVPRRGPAHRSDAYKAIRERNQRHVGFYRLFEDYELPAGGGGRKAAGWRAAPGSAGRPERAADHFSARVDPQRHVPDAERIANFQGRASSCGWRPTRTSRASAWILDEVPAPRDVVEIHAADVVEQLKRARPGQDRSDQRPGRAAGARRSPRRSAAGVPRSADAGGRRREGPGLSAHDRRKTTRWFQVMDRPLYDAARGARTQGDSGLAPFWGKPVRAFRAGVTLTAKFIEKNIVRDATTAFIRPVGSSDQGRDVRGPVRAFRHAGWSTWPGPRARRPVETVSAATTRRSSGSIACRPISNVRRLARAGTVTRPRSTTWCGTRSTRCGSCRRSART